MSKFSKRLSLPLFFVIQCLLLSCGGTNGGSTTGVKITSIEGTGGTGGGKTSKITSLGIVSNSDILRINNIDYTTNNTTEILVDNQELTQQALLDGQVVLAFGNSQENTTTRTANSIRYNSNVIGPIDSINTPEQKIRILEQNITINQDTVLGNNLEAFNDLSHGQITQVSGFINSEGDILATRLDVLDGEALSAGTHSHQIIGAVSNLDPTQMTFNINDLVINYENLPSLINITDDSSVKVNGTLTNGQLVASVVEQIPTSLGDAGGNISIAGFVTDMDSPTNVSISGFPVIINTQSIDNGTLEDIQLDARLEVYGKLDEQGLIIAERIIIIQTAPIVFEGLLQAEEVRQHTIRASDDDIGIWVSVSGLDDLSALFVTTGDQLFSAQCIARHLNKNNDGLCYVENNGDTEWNIFIKSVTENTHYRVDVFFRRTEYSTETLINADTPTPITQYKGDRNLYRLPTKNAPEGSYLAVTLEGLGSDGQFYVFANGQDISSPEVCRISNEGFQKTCWLRHDNVSDWYILIESNTTKNYILHTDFIIPEPLATGRAIDSSIDSIHGALYQLDTNADSSAGIAISQPSNKTELRVSAENIPLTLSHDCWSRDYTNISPAPNLQCIVGSDEPTTWYALVTGDLGTSFTIKAETQTQTPPLATLALGEKLQVPQQLAASTALYRVAKEANSDIFVAGINDNNPEATFQLAVMDNSPTAPDLCKEKSAISTKRHCYIDNDGDGYWYIAVQSANEGGYELWTDTRNVVPITLTQTISGSIPTDDIGAGVIYRLTMDEAHTGITTRVSQRDGLTSLVADFNNLPGSRIGLCSNLNAALAGSCISHNTDTLDPGTWYIVFYGEPGASYEFHTETK